MLQRVFAYLWIAPNTSHEQETALRLLREHSLRAACAERGWEMAELAVDRSLSKRADERPLLKSLLKKLGENDILLVQSTLDLGQRFYDVYALMDMFRHTTKGSFVALEQELRINRHESSEVLMVLSRIPQLNGTRPPSPASSHRRSEVSRCNGGACPYGYYINPDNNEYALEASESEVVRRIFKDRLRGRSLRQICDSLTRSGISTKRGGRWHANTIKSILENPFYTGVYQTHYATLDKHHPEIVSSAMFYELNGHLMCDDIAS